MIDIEKLKQILEETQAHAEELSYTINEDEDDELEQSKHMHQILNNLNEAIILINETEV